MLALIILGADSLRAPTVGMGDAVFGLPQLLQDKLAQCEFQGPREEESLSEPESLLGWRFSEHDFSEHNGPPAAANLTHAILDDIEQVEKDPHIWANYKQFHAEGVLALRNGESRSLLVWRCLSEDRCGGNGDQLKGLLTTFFYAVYTRRLFFIQ